MKKLNLWLLVSLFVAAFTLTACGDNDDDTPSETNPLFGRWEAQHSFGADTNISYAFVLGANNNISYEYRMYSAGGGLHNGYILTGTYQVSGQTITVTFTKFQRLTGDKDTFEQVDQYVYTYRLENNKLYISGDDTNGKEFNNTEFVKK
jgi:hypothetical protein